MKELLCKGDLLWMELFAVISRILLDYFEFLGKSHLQSFIFVKLGPAFVAEQNKTFSRHLLVAASYIDRINSFQPIVTFYIETSHFIRNENRFV